MFQATFVEKFETHILCPVTFSRKSCRLCDNVEKYRRTRQATDDIIRRMRFACWITKATETHSEYIILIAFDGNSGYANAPQCYVGEEKSLASAPDSPVVLSVAWVAILTELPLLPQKSTVELGYKGLNILSRYNRGV